MSVAKMPGALPIGGGLGGGGLGGGADPGAAPGGGAAGKGFKSQNLGSPHAGQMSTLAGGEPLSRMMGQYKKGHSFAAPVGIRGGGGGMKRNPTQGGIGPGKAGAVGSASDYSMTNPDME